MTSATNPPSTELPDVALGRVVEVYEMPGPGMPTVRRTPRRPTVTLAPRGPIDSDGPDLLRFSVSPGPIFFRQIRIGQFDLGIRVTVNLRDSVGQPRVVEGNLTSAPTRIALWVRSLDAIFTLRVADQLLAGRNGRDLSTLGDR